MIPEQGLWSSALVPVSEMDTYWSLGPGIGSGLGAGLGSGLGSG